VARAGGFDDLAVAALGEREPTHHLLRPRRDPRVAGFAAETRGGLAGLDLYAQAVTALGEAAAAAMGARFLGSSPLDRRAMESDSGGAGQ
jgi:hypothetical protein